MARTIRLSLALGCLLSVTTALQSCAAAIYHFTDLGEIGTIGSTANDINDSGQITGVTRPASTHAFLWQPEVPNSVVGTMIDLDTGSNTPGVGPVSNGNAINASGRVAGISTFIGVSGTDAAFWAPNTPNATVGGWTDIPRTPGSTFSVGRGVNAFGQVAGYVFNASATGPNRAFVCNPTSPGATTGSSTLIGDLPGGDDNAQAYAINATGQIVGFGTTASNHRAFLWTPTTPNASTGSMVEVDNLSPTTDSEADGMNDAGTIVGTRTVGPGVRRAYRWTPTTPNGSTGSMTDLGDLGLGFGSKALDINDAGTIVGEVYTSSASGNPRAFIWTPGSGMVDLNTLVDSAATGWRITNARGINNLGQITGEATLYDGNNNAIITDGFLLSPIPFVPEPSGLGLMLGLVAACATRRRAMPRA